MCDLKTKIWLSAESGSFSQFPSHMLYYFHTPWALGPTHCYLRNHDSVWKHHTCTTDIVLFCTPRQPFRSTNSATQQGNDKISLGRECWISCTMHVGALPSIDQTCQSLLAFNTDSFDNLMWEWGEGSNKLWCGCKLHTHHTHLSDLQVLSGEATALTRLQWVHVITPKAWKSLFLLMQTKKGQWFSTYFLITSSRLTFSTCIDPIQRLMCTDVQVTCLSALDNSSGQYMNFWNVTFQTLLRMIYTVCVCGGGDWGGRGGGKYF